MFTEDVKVQSCSTRILWGQTETLGCLADDQRNGLDRAQEGCHPQTTHTSRIAVIQTLQGLFMLTHKSSQFCFVFLQPVQYQPSEMEPSVFSEWCLWLPHYTSWSQGLHLNQNWSDSEHIWGSQWARENRTLCFGLAANILHCNYLDCSRAMEDTVVIHYWGDEGETYLWPTVDSKPSSPIVLFIMIKWTRRRDKHASGHNKCIFLCV